MRPAPSLAGPDLRTGPAVAPPIGRHRWAGPVLLALLAGLAVVVIGHAADAVVGPTAGQEVLGPGAVTVTLDVEHSRFSPAELHVRPGTVVTFVVVNDDPIHHELIVGPPEVHRRHERGTEAEHPPIEGEVTIGPNETATTFYRFDEPGTVAFACHLPGHVAYGMVGQVHVTG